MKTRKLNPAPATRGPKTATDWRKLMIRVIARARTVGDPRLSRLLAAQTQGAEEACLRKLSIISDADIQREFPDPL